MEGVERRTLLAGYAAEVVAPLSTATTGSQPTGPLLIDAQGNLYGTTAGDGGWTDGGKVFEIPEGSATPVALQTFSAKTQDYPYEPDGGRAPRGSLGMDAAGNIYGATAYGGEWNGGRIGGTLFRIDGATHQFSTLVSINSLSPDLPPPPYYPLGGVVADAAGNLYGTSSNVTSGARGQIFEWDAANAKVVTLALFNDTTGYQPTGPLVRDAAGNLFGVTSDGGAHWQGTIFELPAGSDTIRVLYTFDQSGSVVHHAESLAIDASGNLYGAMAADDSASVFRLSPDGTFTVLATRTGDFIDGDPGTGVAVDGAGNVFQVGAFDAVRDAMYEVPAGSGAFVQLAAFGADVGRGSKAAPVIDGHGYLYGTTTAGGANGMGAVYRIAPADAPTLPVGATPPATEPPPVAPPTASRPRLQFERTVTNVGAGETLPVIKVDVRDAGGKLLTAGRQRVTLRVVSRDGTWRLLGTVTAVAVHGVATFRGLSVRQANTYLLEATAGGFDAADSNTFVVRRGAVVKIVLGLPRKSILVDDSINPGVTLYDRFGNLATDASASVVLSIGSRTADAALTGTKTATPQDGFAYFGDVRIRKAGRYTLVAKWGRLTARSGVLAVRNQS